MTENFFRTTPMGGLDRFDNLGAEELRLWRRVYDQARLEVGSNGRLQPDGSVHAAYMGVLMDQALLDGDDGKFRRLEAIMSGLINNRRIGELTRDLGETKGVGDERAR